MAQWGENIGIFATDALALADIQAKMWDSNGDGTGTPRNGMRYYDSTTNQEKTWENGAWTALGSEGEIACLGIAQVGQPLANDLITIGADVYEFAGVGGNINVAISGVNAEGTLDNLLAAAVANGTENLFWEKLSATQLRLSYADGPQGNLIPGSANIACTEATTNYVLEPATPTNINELGGVVAAGQRSANMSVTVQANMVAGGVILRLRFPFAVVRFTPHVMTAAGALRSGFADTFTLNSGDILITFAAGGAADLVATDVVHIEAKSA